MHTIEAYENDIKSQSEFLKIFKKQKPLSEKQQKNTIFTGSGDSLSSAMLAEVFSNFSVRYMDPLDLLKNKSLSKNRSVYFVSISGNTISNIKVAKTAKKSVAITSKPNSRLAQASHQTILLQSPNADVFTAGSISFLESALTCISLVSHIGIPKNYNFYQKAYSEAKKSKITSRIFVLGNMHTYPIAMYCAAKFYELLGYDAHYERIEQFSHMELFSAKKGDTVIIFEEKNAHNTQLLKNLKKVGLNTILPKFDSKNKISQIIFYTFFSQLLPLFEAKKHQKKDCNFVLSKNLRKVSDNMIY
ncbi:MAG: sugar isomerase [Nitrosopumilaceae archaeon]|jgi:fructoselysine-6-P-deglycase FrlB-like protein|uniref:Sugar isomerase n=1 Tax=Candidatus Nitrosomaritimum aestuariumsis TaxID=3342354 RepID=A0AC60W7Y5_9ARCH|nr:sugar isomerase [Nitrosopumilaceae archaeon]MBA4462491.1 sugar isomerase [Nitrosopumilaceae archaeon]MBA4463485.1 sugar isomerase [Nitrosopumilaceae archaeon]NCF21975.1 sugar isomerase [Nitrosopumilaceae archaeon]